MIPSISRGAHHIGAVVDPVTSELMAISKASLALRELEAFVYLSKEQVYPPKYSIATGAKQLSFSTGTYRDKTPFRLSDRIDALLMTPSEYIDTALEQMNDWTFLPPLKYSKHSVLSRYLDVFKDQCPAMKSRASALADHPHPVASLLGRHMLLSLEQLQNTDPDERTAAAWACRENLLDTLKGILLSPHNDIKAEIQACVEAALSSSDEAIFDYICRQLILKKCGEVLYDITSGMNNPPRAWLLANISQFFDVGDSQYAIDLFGKLLSDGLLGIEETAELKAYRIVFTGIDDPLIKLRMMRPFTTSADDTCLVGAGLDIFSTEEIDVDSLFKMDSATLEEPRPSAPVRIHLDPVPSLYHVIEYAISASLCREPGTIADGEYAAIANAAELMLEREAQGERTIGLHTLQKLYFLSIHHADIERANRYAATLQSRGQFQNKQFLITLSEEIDSNENCSRRLLAQLADLINADPEAFLPSPLPETVARRMFDGVSTTSVFEKGLSLVRSCRLRDSKIWTPLLAAAADPKNEIHAQTIWEMLQERLSDAEHTLSLEQAKHIRVLASKDLARMEGLLASDYFKSCGNSIEGLAFCRHVTDMFNDCVRLVNRCKTSKEKTSHGLQLRDNAKLLIDALPTEGNAAVVKASAEAKKVINEGILNLKLPRTYAEECEKVEEMAGRDPNISALVDRVVALTARSPVAVWTGPLIALLQKLRSKEIHGYNHLNTAEVLCSADTPEADIEACRQLQEILRRPHYLRTAAAPRKKGAVQKRSEGPSNKERFKNAFMLVAKRRGNTPDVYKELEKCSEYTYIDNLVQASEVRDIKQSRVNKQKFENLRAYLGKSSPSLKSIHTRVNSCLEEHDINIGALFSDIEQALMESPIASVEDAKAYIAICDLLFLNAARMSTGEDSRIESKTIRLLIHALHQKEQEYQNKFLASTFEKAATLLRSKRIDKKQFLYYLLLCTIFSHDRKGGRYSMRVRTFMEQGKHLYSLNNEDTEVTLFQILEKRVPPEPDKYCDTNNVRDLMDAIVSELNSDSATNGIMNTDFNSTLMRQFYQSLTTIELHNVYLRQIAEVKSKLSEMKQGRITLQQFDDSTKTTINGLMKTYQKIWWYSSNLCMMFAKIMTPIAMDSKLALTADELDAYNKRCLSRMAKVIAGGLGKSFENNAETESKRRELLTTLLLWTRNVTKSKALCAKPAILAAIELFDTWLKGSELPANHFKCITNDPTDNTLPDIYIIFHQMTLDFFYDCAHLQSIYKEHPSSLLALIQGACSELPKHRQELALLNTLTNTELTAHVIKLVFAWLAVDDSRRSGWFNCLKSTMKFSIEQEPFATKGHEFFNVVDDLLTTLTDFFTDNERIALTEAAREALTTCLDQHIGELAKDDDHLNAFIRVHLTLHTKVVMKMANRLNSMPIMLSLLRGMTTLEKRISQGERFILASIIFEYQKNVVDKLMDPEDVPAEWNELSVALVSPLSEMFAKAAADAVRNIGREPIDHMDEEQTEEFYDQFEQVSDSSDD